MILCYNIVIILSGLVGVDGIVNPVVVIPVVRKLFRGRLLSLGALRRFLRCACFAIASVTPSRFSSVQCVHLT